MLFRQTPESKKPGKRTRAHARRGTSGREAPAPLYTLVAAESSEEVVDVFLRYEDGGGACKASDSASPMPGASRTKRACQPAIARSQRSWSSSASEGRTPKRRRATPRRSPVPRSPRAVAGVADRSAEGAVCCPCDVTGWPLGRRHRDPSCLRRDSRRTSRNAALCRLSNTMAAAIGQASQHGGLT
jgi:hypothetical protein